MKLLNKIKLAYHLFTKSIDLTDSASFKTTFAEFLTAKNASKNTGYVSSCANVWGLSFAKAIPRVYDKEKKNAEWENHPAVDILKNPFPGFTGWELMYRIASDMIFEGNCYILKLRPVSNRLMKPVSGLYPLQADRMNTYPYNMEHIEYYEYSTGNGIIRIEKDDIIHLKAPDRKSIIKGSPVISRISDVVDVEKMQIEYRKQFYTKGGMLGATFVTEQNLSPDVFDNRLARLREQYGGNANAFKVAMFDNGFKPVPTAYSLKDMQITEDRRLNMIEICSAFNVNKLFFGESENIQRGNADTVYYVFYSSTIDPLLSYIAQVLTTQFLSVDFKATDNTTSLYFGFDPLAMRDKETDYKCYKLALDAGWMLPSEPRNAEGFASSPELDSRYLQSKLQAQPAK